MSGIAEQVYHLRLRQISLLAGIAAEQKVHGANPDVLNRLNEQLDMTEQQIAMFKEHADKLPDQILAKQLGLDGEAIRLLWSAAALAGDPTTLPHSIALIGADARRGMTVLLHAVIHGLRGNDARSLLNFLSGDSLLLRTGILESADSTVVAGATPLVAHPRVLSFLRGKETLDLRVAREGGVITLPSPLRYDSEQQAALDKLVQVVAMKKHMIAIVSGPFGSGRKTAIGSATSANDRQAVFLECKRLPMRPEQMRESLRAFQRECTLRNAVPVIADIDDMPTSEQQDGKVMLQLLLSFAESQPGPVFITTKYAGLEMTVTSPLVQVHWPVPGTETRSELWIDALGDTHSLTPDELDHIGMRYRMGAGGIFSAVQSARLVRLSQDQQDGKLNQTDVVHGIRGSVADRLGGLAQRVETKQSWDDLVLATDILDQVKTIVARIRHAHTVYEKWGFRSKTPKGTGVSCLFSGPPGTGKTMVAGVIAKELGLELYQVDLSKVTSKWVGETEKNLSKVFDATEAGHALLLFDEADSLFAKRTEVKGANDRYANLEVNYLLQRVEAFGGVTVLTTNLETSIDDALKRRLSSHVVFWKPDVEERIELWKRLLPKTAPKAKDIDFEELADRFHEMSGAHIRNAVLGAAFLAASEDSQINQEILERAARAIYRTMGHTL